MLLPCPQPIGLNGCKKRETRNNHRPCGHVDEQRSVLLTRRMAVKIRLGTVALIVPRSRRPMAPAEVVPARQQLVPIVVPKEETVPVAAPATSWWLVDTVPSHTLERSARDSPSAHRP